MGYTTIISRHGLMIKLHYELCFYALGAWESWVNPKKEKQHLGLRTVALGKSKTIIFVVYFTKFELLRVRLVHIFKN